ncbi:MAG: phage scaffolding protein [Clostridia bacterium]|nr:phage scaffolding protein [Clostridia bacterium]
MAFTRADIRAILGEAHTEDIENRLIALHLGVVDPLKDSVQTYKTDAEKLPGVQKELDDLKKAGNAAEVQAAFDAYKQQVEGEKANAAKTSAVRAALKAAGVNRDEFADLLLGKVDLSKVELDGDKVKDADGLIAPLKGSYAGCFGTVTDKGTPPANPPAGGGKGMTKDQILAIKDPAEQRMAIAQNLDLFNK